jgi:hypothetical protein
VAAVPEPTEQVTLKQLLADSVEGFEELELLAWLGARNEEPADIELIAREVRLPAEIAESTLARLVSRGFLAVSGDRPERYSYAPGNDSRETIDRIVGEYRANPTFVMKLMTENAIERVRNAALKTFAECFRIRKPGSNG